MNLTQYTFLIVNQTVWPRAIEKLTSVTKSLVFKCKQCDKVSFINDVIQIWNFSDPLPTLSH